MLVVGPDSLYLNSEIKPYIDAFLTNLDGRNIEPLIKPKRLKQTISWYS